eukprot:TRINITY_DN10116_c0_g1_i2.p1 TRINITY_DN10116_c0_g1~~TRINITY_DN10116_c0_g1_i2.p1  ORF type:complete len:809 (-),score=160.59 TRINITY_DN10116_c0_g1_i2:21-2447(-)
MERLKAGLGKLRVANDKVYDKVALAKDFASELKVAALQVKVGTVPTRFLQGRQYNIGSRTVVEDKQISEGGFAFVWLARDASTNKELALKKILCQDKASLAMAEREIQLLQRLPIHPNLVRYFGSTALGTENKKTKEIALLFEFCSGGHLLNLLEKHQGLLKEKQVVDTLKEVVAGVAVLHDISPPVQHRDLKVENVLLGADGHWKLLDFGSWSDERIEPGKLDKPSLSALQEQIERYTTMMYRPPEMVDFYLEFAITEKVDIWMIGCILYTLMFYRQPFQDESTLAIANARYQLPSSPKFSDKMQDLIHWLLARDPSDRPSAHELLLVLQSLEDDCPLQLPKAVVERRDHFRRLYGDAPSSKASAGQRLESSSHEPTSSEKKSKQRHHGKDSKDRRSSKTKEPSDDPWRQAVSSQAWPPAAAPCGLEATPAAAFSAPEPSRFGWADFGSECCGFGGSCSSTQTPPSQDGHELQLQQPNSSATTSLLQQKSSPGKTSPRQRPKALSPQVNDPWSGLPYANMPSTGSRSPSSHRSCAGRSSPQGKQDAGSFWSLAPEAQDAGQAAPPRPRTSQKQLEPPEVGMDVPRRAHRRVASGISGSTWPMFPDVSPTARSASLPPESPIAADASPSGKTRRSSVTEGSPCTTLDRRSPPSITIQGPPVQPPPSWAAKSPASSSRAEVSPEQSPSTSPRPRGSGASKASAAAVAATAVAWPCASSQKLSPAWPPSARGPGVAWPGVATQAVSEVPMSTLAASSPAAWPAEVTSTPGGEEDPWKAVMSAGPSPDPSPKADGFAGFGQGGKPTWNAFE